MTSVDPNLNEFGLAEPDMAHTFDPTVAATQIGNLLSILTGGGSGAGAESGSAASYATPATPSTPTPAAPTGASANGAVASTTFGHPVEGPLNISQAYGGDNHHPGEDIAVPTGTPVLAATAGKVTHAGSDDPNGYGTWVEITGADGTVTRYGHLSGLNVTQGQVVGQGQLLGPSGATGNATGPHLHFEVRVNGDTVDPAPYLAGGYQVIGSGTATAVTSDTPSAANSAIPPPPPEEILGNQLSNTIDILTGNAPSKTTGQVATAGKTSSTSTTPAAGGKSTLSNTTSGSDADPGAIDAFLNATKQHESGGDYTARNNSGQSNAAGAYQFLGSTWKGMGGSTASAADASPAEQDAIARKMATDLFARYHSWRLVAIAWYGGPGIADEVAAGSDPGSPEGQGSYLAYGNTIASMMSGGGG